MTTLTINIDEQIKVHAQKKAQKDGLTLTALIAQFLKGYLKNNWELTLTPGEELLKEHKRALKEIYSGKAELFDTAEEMSRKILSE